MVQKLLLVFIIGILAVGCTRIEAQNPPTLSLQQAEQIALKHNPQVFAARYNALASEQRVREARSAYFPTAYGSITGAVADRETRIGAGVITAPRLFSHEGQGISIDQLITDSGRTPNLVASSRLAASAQQENARAARYDVLLAVNHAYFEVLRAQALVQVAQETVAERNVVYEQVEAMVQNKLKSGLDLSFAKVNLGQAQLLEIRTDDNLKAADAELTRALGLETSQQYKLMPESLPAAPPPTANSLVAEAMQNRPELAGLRLGRQSAYKFENAERDLSYPTLVVAGDAGYIPVIAQLTLPRMIPNHYEVAAFNLEVPIFNGHLFA
ncbi:MAG: TolC family protein, partial [Terriglobia bacterium]